MHPPREVVVTFRPEQSEAFGAAWQLYLDAEPLVRGGSIVGNQAKAILWPLWQLDGPNAGTWAQDRPRAVGVLRRCVPVALVVSATVDGEDWQR